MPFSHLLLILLIVVIWGINFIFIKIDLEEFSPLFLCSLRFLLSSIPAVFFIPKPAVPWRLVVLYGLVMFGLQFTLIFMGMYLGMTAGMTSILMQTQVFFSMFFAALVLGEKLTGSQISGALVSFAGVGLVALHFDSSISLAGFLFIIAGAATWGVGNLIAKKMGSVNMMALVIWGSLFASIPILLLSLLIEGPSTIVYSYHHVSFLGIVALLYIVYLSTWIGYGGFNWLLSHYPVASIAPFTFLIPIVAMLSSALILNESFQLWKALSGLLVVTGLVINLVGTRYFVKKLEAELV